MSWRLRTEAALCDLTCEDHHDAEGHQEDLIECHHPEMRMIINCTPLKSTFLLMLRRTEWNVMDVSQFVKAENEPENISGLEFNKRYQHPCAPP